MLTVGGRVLDVVLVSFQFLMSGVVVGVLVATHYLWGRRWVTLAALAAYFLILLANRIEDPQTRISFAVYVAVLYLGTTGGLFGDRLWPGLKFGKFVAWGALFGCLHLASVPFLGWALSQTPEPGMALSAARLGATIGAATGLGNDLEFGVYGRLLLKNTPRGAFY